MSVIIIYILNYTQIKFVTPREIKVHLELDNVSFRTIDRVLIRHNLFGRIARVVHPNFDPRKRLSWCQGILI